MSSKQFADLLDSTQSAGPLVPNDIMFPMDCFVADDDDNRLLQMSYSKFQLDDCMLQLKVHNTNS